MKKYSVKIIVGAVIIGAAVAARLSGADRYINLETLRRYREDLLVLVDANYAAAALAYIALYIAATSLSLPGAAVLTLAGGFVFGLWGVLYVNIGATAGAFLAFLAARYLLGNWMQERYGERLDAFNRKQ